MNNNMIRIIQPIVLAITFFLIYFFFLKNDIDKKPIYNVIENPGKTVNFANDYIRASVNLKGAKIDSLSFKKYKANDFKTNVEFVQTKIPHYFEFGIISSNTSTVLPSQDDIWILKSQNDFEIVLSWNKNPDLTIERTITLDDKYMIDIKDKITNTTDQNLMLYFYGLLLKHRPVDKTENITFESTSNIAICNDTKLNEITYETIQKTPFAEKIVKGWAGFNDKYWLSSFILKDESNIVIQNNQNEIYQMNVVSPAYQVLSMQTQEFNHRVFAGPKEAKLLDYYKDTQQIAKFDMAIDFGFLYFITKPLFYFLNFMNGFVGNLGICILLLTVLIKILLWPLASKSFASMERMKKLQPEIERLKKQHGEDKAKINAEMMALYKKHKVNPASGCFPMLMQMPVFFALYKVLMVNIEMRHTSFLGWVSDLSEPDPSSLFNLFGLLPYDVPSFLQIGLLPLIMGLVMFIQHRMSPKMQDPMQQNMMMLMPIVLVIVFANMPSGLVIYTTWTYIISIFQQRIIKKSKK